VTAGLLLALAVSVAWNGVLLLLRMRNDGSDNCKHQHKQAATAHGLFLQPQSDTKLYPSAQHADVAGRHHQVLNVRTGSARR
jgi:hypothetical protein